MFYVHRRTPGRHVYLFAARGPLLAESEIGFLLAGGEDAGASGRADGLDGLVGCSGCGTGRGDGAIGVGDSMGTDSGSGSWSVRQLHASALDSDAGSRTFCEPASSACGRRLGSPDAACAPRGAFFDFEAGGSALSLRSGFPESGLATMSDDRSPSSASCRPKSSCRPKMDSTWHARGAFTGCSLRALVWLPYRFQVSGSAFLTRQCSEDRRT